MDSSMTDAQKKDSTTKDGATWDPEACGLLYRSSDCCVSNCTYTTDHYHCQICGTSAADVSQALAHVRASPLCRKEHEILFHHPTSSSVSMPADPTNSLYSAIYNGFTGQNTYPTPGYSGFSQIDSYQWHPTMPDKVAICSSQLSPCCSSNGGTFIPVESQLCSPISDLYSKVTAPIRDLVSLPAKSSGSTIDSPAWFAAYNQQQIQKPAYKYSDQNGPQINYILLDPADPKHQDAGESGSNLPSSFCTKPDLGGKDTVKETFCSFASQPLPGMLSEDALFSLQLQDETLKQAESQQTFVSQMILSDVNLPGKSAGQIDSGPTTSREDSHFTQEHFNHYISSCIAYHSQEQQNSIEETTSNQPSSSASDSDESDIIVEDTGDDRASQMTESEIFIEDIKCSLLQGVVDEEERRATNSEVYQSKGGKTVDLVRKDPEDRRPLKEVKIQPESQIKNCISSYHPLLKCVICEKSVSDGNPGSVFVEMNNQMPLTTSSQTPVLTKLNEVVAVEVTDFLDYNGKFMCQTCFNLVDTVDSLESKLESLKQDIATMIKNGSKPHSFVKLPVSIMDNGSANLSVSSDVKDRPPNSVCVQGLFRNSLLGPTGVPKPDTVLQQTNCQAIVDPLEQKEYLLLSGRALSLANSINKVSLSLGQHLSEVSVHQGDQEPHRVGHEEESQTVSAILNISSTQCQTSTVHPASKNEDSHGQEERAFMSPRSKQSSSKSPKRSRMEGKSEGESEHRKDTCHSVGSVKRVSEREQMSLPPKISSENQQEIKQKPHSSIHIADNNEIQKPNPELLNHDSGGSNIQQQDSLTCDLCEELFSSRNHLEMHLSRYSNSDSALCELCGKLYHNCVQLDDHMFHAHSVYRKHCGSCGKRFFHQCMYSAHLENPCDVDLDRVSRHTCDECNQTISQQSEGRCVNITQLSQKVISKCDVCERTFTKPSDLQAHKRSHSDEKNFLCKVCGRRYKSLGNLNHHAKSHEAAKPYTCEFCSQGFIRKDFYETHLNSHRDSKPFKCNKCQKSFSSKSYLQSHLNWHLDKTKKVTCPVCKKSFSQRLKVHMRSHTGERPHPCPKCPKKFITGSAMRKHMKQIHTHKILPGKEHSSSAGSDQCSSDSEPDSSYLCPD